MQCPICDRDGLRYGKDRKGRQRYFCRQCKISFSEPSPPRPFGRQYLTMERATTAIKLLVEGSSIRSVCRILRLGPYTLLQLLLKIGNGCERLLEQQIVGVPCSTVQCDEIWSFVWCKEKTRIRKGYHEEELGDCYTWTALDPATKLLLAYAVGKRDNATAMQFVRRLRRSAAGEFQINTDGLGIYQSVIPIAFGNNQDHARIIKIFATPAEGEARYSPPQIIDLQVLVGSGEPDLDLACTSHVERSNLTIRTMLRRFTRLTNAHSKQWRYHKAAIALMFAYYNFCRRHMTIECAPAVAAGVTDHAWSVKELIERVFPREDAVHQA